MSVKRILEAVFFLILTCWGLPQPLMADQVYFYHTDPAGTPLAMTDSSGAVVWKADYKPFGEENSTTGAATNDRRFVGKEKDEETGLSYFGARYEDAKIGRFIAPDPVRAVDPNTSKTNEKLLVNPQRLNTYAYALNNPNKYIDPDGKDVAFIVDPNGAGGNGHASLYFQDSKGNWYAYNQGAAGDTSSGGNLGFLLGSNAPAGVSIEPVQGPPKGSVVIKTNKLQDDKIAKSALRSQMLHNYEGKDYNLYSNNCKDAVSEVINNSGSGLKVQNSKGTIRPNSWFNELKVWNTK
ncbi:RHS repeat-associated core domain-containing protein [Geobacter sp.]|uniref:RHS repeat domain-containing protein n=1 Tax=Geobacter sp. TaxID=46610 RepID=UPI0026253DF2|nr:RHS repeat-associated core domain-containing protein [Geobacter sp.]